MKEPYSPPVLTSNGQLRDITAVASPPVGYHWIWVQDQQKLTTDTSLY